MLKDPGYFWDPDVRRSTTAEQSLEDILILSYIKKIFQNKILQGNRKRGDVKEQPFVTLDPIYFMKYWTAKYFFFTLKSISGSRIKGIITYWNTLKKNQHFFLKLFFLFFTFANN